MEKIFEEFLKLTPEQRESVLKTMKTAHTNVDDGHSATYWACIASHDGQCGTCTETGGFIKC